jgi:hypothetical protein
MNFTHFLCYLPTIYADNQLLDWLGVPFTGCVLAEGLSGIFFYLHLAASTRSLALSQMRIG